MPVPLPRVFFDLLLAVPMGITGFRVIYNDGTVTHR